MSQANGPRSVPEAYERRVSKLNNAVYVKRRLTEKVTGQRSHTADLGSETGPVKQSPLNVDASLRPSDSVDLAGLRLRSQLLDVVSDILGVELSVTQGLVRDVEVADVETGSGKVIFKMKSIRSPPRV